MGTTSPGIRGWAGGGWMWEGGGRGVLVSGCEKLICDVAEQRNVNLFSKFRDIDLINIICPDVV